MKYHKIISKISDNQITQQSTIQNPELPINSVHNLINQIPQHLPPTIPSNIPIIPQLTEASPQKVNQLADLFENPQNNIIQQSAAIKQLEKPLKQIINIEEIANKNSAELKTLLKETAKLHPLEKENTSEYKIIAYNAFQKELTNKLTFVIDGTVRIEIIRLIWQSLSDIEKDLYKVRVNQHDFQVPSIDRVALKAASKQFRCEEKRIRAEERRRHSNSDEAISEESSDNNRKMHNDHKHQKTHKQIDPRVLFFVAYVTKYKKEFRKDLINCEQTEMALENAWNECDKKEWIEISTTFTEKQAAEIVEAYNKWMYEI